MLCFSQGSYENHEVKTCCIYAEPEVAEAELAEVKAEVERVRQALGLVNEDGYVASRFNVRADGVAVTTFYAREPTGKDIVKTTTTSLHTFGVIGTVVSWDANFYLDDVLLCT